MLVERRLSASSAPQSTAESAHAVLQLGGLEALQADADKVRRAVEFAAACGAFTTTRPGAISAQPSIEEAEELLRTASFAVAPSA